MDGYSWPQLNAREIAQCLNELSIPITDQDILKPNPETVRAVFLVLIEFLNGVNREDIERHSPESLANLEFPEIFLDATSETAFYRHLFRLLRAVGVNDFSIQTDLHNPTGKRVIHILSAIINFAKFREERLSMYNELTSEADMFLERRQQLFEQNQRLEEEKRQLAALREREEPRVNQLQSETSQLQESVTALNKQQVMLQERSQEIKQENNQLKEKLSSASGRIQELQTEINRMKSHVVQSPQRMKRNIEEMSDTLESERREVNQAERRYRELQARADQLNKLEADLIKVLQLIEASANEKAKSKMASQEMKAILTRKDEAQSIIRELQTTHRCLHLELEGAQEKLKRLQQQQQQRQEAARQSIEQLKLEIIAQTKDRSDIQSAIDQNASLTATIESKIDSLKKEHRAEMAMLNDRYAQLEEQVRVYHRLLCDAMGLYKH